MGHIGVTIESSEECEPQKVILEKPSVEMTRHMKPLYVKAHLNGKPVSKVLIDNGSMVNVMPLRMLIGAFHTCFYTTNHLSIIWYYGVFKGSNA